MIQFIPEYYSQGFSGIESGLTALMQGLADRFSPNARESRTAMMDPTFNIDPLTQSFTAGSMKAFRDKYPLDQWIFPQDNPNNFYNSMFGGPSGSSTYTPTQDYMNTLMSIFNLQGTDVVPKMKGGGEVKQPKTEGRPDLSRNLQVTDAMKGLITGAPAPEETWEYRQWVAQMYPALMAQVIRSLAMDEKYSKPVPQMEQGGEVEKRMNPAMATLFELIGIERGKGEVPIRAHEGEYIVRKEAVDAVGEDFLDAINSIPKAEKGKKVESPKGENTGPFSGMSMGNKGMEVMQALIASILQSQMEKARSGEISSKTEPYFKEGSRWGDRFKGTVNRMTGPIDTTFTDKLKALGESVYSYLANPRENYENPIRKLGEGTLPYDIENPQGQEFVDQIVNSLAGKVAGVMSPVVHLSEGEEPKKEEKGKPEPPPTKKDLPETKGEEEGTGGGTPPDFRTMLNDPKYRPHWQNPDIPWDVLQQMPVGEAAAYLQKVANTQGQAYQPRFGANNQLMPSSPISPQMQLFAGLMQQFAGNADTEGKQIANAFGPASNMADIGYKEALAEQARRGNLIGQSQTYNTLGVDKQSEVAKRYADMANAAYDNARALLAEDPRNPQRRKSVMYYGLKAGLASGMIPADATYIDIMNKIDPPKGRAKGMNEQQLSELARENPDKYTKLFADTLSPEEVTQILLEFQKIGVNPALGVGGGGTTFADEAKRMSETTTKE
jgi:hypothetical protein